jgi:hypothetical protein
MTCCPNHTRGKRHADGCPAIRGRGTAKPRAERPDAKEFDRRRGKMRPYIPHERFLKAVEAVKARKLFEQASEMLEGLLSPGGPENDQVRNPLP